MIEAETALTKLRAISKTSAFNEWLGLEVTAASEGSAELQLAWRSEFGQYSGFLHAGLEARGRYSAERRFMVTASRMSASSHQGKRF